MIIRMLESEHYFTAVNSKIIVAYIPLLLRLDVVKRRNWFKTLKRMSFALRMTDDRYLWFESLVMAIHSGQLRTCTPSASPVVCIDASITPMWASHLYAIIKNLIPDNVSSQLLKELEDIREERVVYQCEADMSYCSRVSYPHGDCVLNCLVFFDLITFNTREVLHFVIHDTKFSVVCHLEIATFKEIWNAFTCVWVTEYVWYSKILAVDQGPEIISGEWANLADAADITGEGGLTRRSSRIPLL